MSRIKICGLMRPIDAEYINEAMPDMVGMILSPNPKFRRRITRKTAEEITEKLDPSILVTGVFVNQTIDEILAYEDLISQIQLHGSENNSFIHKLKERTSKPVIKAFKAGTITEEEMNLCPADYYLIDSGQGTGKTFDWSLIPRSNKPWILAGGISSENVREAIERLHPYAVDLSSSVETDGNKDRKKIIKIVDIVRNTKEETNEER